MSPRRPAPPSLTPAVFHVLLALAGGPRHGYAIMQEAAQTAGPRVPMGPGTVYGTLQRLLDSGMVALAQGDRAEKDGGASRGRRLFCLRPAGREALLAEAQRLARLAELSQRAGLLVAPEE